MDEQPFADEDVEEACPSCGHRPDPLRGIEPCDCPKEES